MECAERRRSVGNGQTTFVIRGMKDTCIVENEIEKALMTAKRTLEQDNVVWKVWEWGCYLSDSLSKSSGRINGEVWLS